MLSNRFHFVLPLFLITQNAAVAQNLVLNPSFEQLKPKGETVACEFMQWTWRFTETIETWTTFRGMTPDILQAADNCPLLPTVHSGERCGGLIYYLPAVDSGEKDGYREAIQGELVRPLRPGVRYRVGLWLHENPALMNDHIPRFYSPETPVVPVKAGNVGFCFSVTPLNGRYPLAQHIRDLKLKPQVNFGEIIATRGEWVYLSATFVPDQPFQFFTIANFFPDAATATDLPAQKHLEIAQSNEKTASVFQKTKRVAYICMDDVYVGPDAPPTVDTSTFVSLETKLLKERRFTFNAALLFDSGKADLRPAAAPELDSLTAFLQKYPRTRLGISGHTDNVGADADNLDLSARRAQAVYQYLLSKGIPPAQIEWKAFGETRPVADNDTEAGRQRNRRVECVVLK